MKLIELKERAMRSIIFHSNNITNQDHDTNSIDFYEEIEGSTFGRQINFQEESGSYIDSDPDLNIFSGCTVNYSDINNLDINSENNNAIQSKESIDCTTHSEQSDVQQNYKQSDINGTLNFNHEQDKNNYLLNALREWSLHGISKKKIDALLALLIPIFPFLPKSYKSLLHTPRKVIVSNLGDGQFWYKGIKVNIRQVLSDEYIHQYGEIVIDINIDGIPLSKSSELHFWPILGKFRDLQHPFLIAVYFGSGKPEVNAFLKDFVAEVADLQERGFQWNDGTTYNFKIDNFVLDAEARSFVKQCIAHGDYYACEKCIVKGTYYRNRMCFFEQNCLRRTDKSFRNRDNPQHHVNNSILEDIGVGMVSQFYLDALHLVYLGVVKRMLNFLISVRSRCTLPDIIVSEINNALCNISGFFPIEFTRKPRRYP